MEIAGTFFQEVIALVGYALMFAAVYKLFQIGTDLGEIKELLKRRTTSLPLGSLASTELPVSAPATQSSYAAPQIPSASVPAEPATPVSYHFDEGESATAYAEQLMRAIQAQSGSSNPK